MRIVRNIFWGILTLCFCSIPTGLFIGLWLLLHPINFWQKLMLTIIGGVFFVPAQIWLGVAWLAVIVMLCGKEATTAPTFNFKNRVGKF